jgi:hypothetical protein
MMGVILILQLVLLANIYEISKQCKHEEWIELTNIIIVSLLTGEDRLTMIDNQKNWISVQQKIYYSIVDLVLLPKMSICHITCCLHLLVLQVNHFQLKVHH